MQKAHGQPCELPREPWVFSAECEGYGMGVLSRNPNQVLVLKSSRNWREVCSSQPPSPHRCWDPKKLQKRIYNLSSSHTRNPRIQRLQRPRDQHPLLHTAACGSCHSQRELRPSPIRSAPVCQQFTHFGSYPVLYPFHFCVCLMMVLLLLI